MTTGVSKSPNAPPANNQTLRLIQKTSTAARNANPASWHATASAVFPRCAAIACEKSRAVIQSRPNSNAAPSAIPRGTSPLNIPNTSITPAAATTPQVSPASRTARNGNNLFAFRTVSLVYPHCSQHVKLYSLMRRLFFMESLLCDFPAVRIHVLNRTSGVRPIFDTRLARAEEEERTSPRSGYRILCQAGSAIMKAVKPPDSFFVPPFFFLSVAPDCCGLTRIAAQIRAAIFGAMWFFVIRLV